MPKPKSIIRPIRLTPELDTKLRLIAKFEGRTISNLMVMMLEKAVREKAQ